MGDHLAATARGTHNRLGVFHAAVFELNLFRTKDGTQVHHCRTCDEYASANTVEVTPEEYEASGAAE